MLQPAGQCKLAMMVNRWSHEVHHPGACVDLCAGNVSFLFLTLAFVQMLKAFTPVVTMLLLFLVGLEAPKARWAQVQRGGARRTQQPHLSAGMSTRSTCICMACRLTLATGN